MSDILFFAGLFLAILLAVSIVVFVALRMRRKGMGEGSRRKVNAAWKHARGLADPMRRVMEADKVLDLALIELGYKGTLGDKLKKAGPRFSDENAVWRAHKLRNTLAHETGARVSDAQATAALRAFERALKDLGA